MSFYVVFPVSGVNSNVMSLDGPFVHSEFLQKLSFMARFIIHDHIRTSGGEQIMRFDSQRYHFIKRRRMELPTG